MKTGTTAACMGGNNDQGEFAAGDKLGHPDFVPWSDVSDVVALATGTWDQICAQTMGGKVSCAGYSFGTTPTLVDASATAVWIDTFGMAKTDDTAVFRAANGRTDCRVKELGLVCDVGIMGNPGAVVDGTYTMDYSYPGMPSGQSRYCWLESNGVASCHYYTGTSPGSPLVKQENVFTSRSAPFPPANNRTVTLT
ncbi:MAG: hypothetical protein U0441_11765 [Polyangiaceae bacterium]